MLLLPYPRSMKHLVERVEDFDKVILKPEATPEDYRKLEEHQKKNAELLKHPTYFSIED